MVWTFFLSNVALWLFAVFNVLCLLLFVSLTSHVITERMKEKSNFSGQKSWWWENILMTQISCWMRCVSAFFSTTAHLIFFHQNLINNFQLNGFYFTLSQVFEQQQRSLLSVFAMKENVFNYEFPSLDQIEVSHLLLHPHPQAMQKQHPTYHRPLRHKILQIQKEFNFCSFLDASSSSTIYHPLWVNWEKHTTRQEKKRFFKWMYNEKFCRKKTFPSLIGTKFRVCENFCSSHLKLNFLTRTQTNSHTHECGEGGKIYRQRACFECVLDKENCSIMLSIFPAK